MNRLTRGLLVGLTTGLALGVAATLFILNTDPKPSSEQPAASILDQVAQELPSHAPNSSENEPVQLPGSIEDILKLRSDFKQTEMLYRLVGAATPKRLIELIREAEELTDTSDRNAALSILFARLTGIDPELALELANDPQFASDEGVYSSVWRNWARADFQAALAKAAEQTPFRKKQRAAWAMYWAVGVSGNAKADEIKRVLGVAPTRWAIAQKIENTARNSIPEAIALINTLASQNEQTSAASNVAVIAVNQVRESALNYKSLFNGVKAQQQFKTRVMQLLGSQSPLVTLQKWEANNFPNDELVAVYAALPQLAREDFELARGYVERVPESTQKSKLVRSLLTVASEQNAIEALVLAQQFEPVDRPGLLAYTVQKLTAISPLEALRAIQAAPDMRQRDHYVAQVIGALANADLPAAQAQVEGFSDLLMRQKARTALVKAWSRVDPNQAIRYALDVPDSEFDRSLGFGGIALDGIELDLGMRFIEKTFDDASQILAYDFGRTLAKRFDVQALLGPLQRYRQNASFTSIRRSLLDEFLRKEDRNIDSFIDAFWQPEERARVVQIRAQRLVNRDPIKALSMFAKMPTEQDKLGFISTVFPSVTDVEFAKSWLAGLADGRVKDQAIASLSARLNAQSASDMRLIASISDAEMRDEMTLYALQDQYQSDLAAMRARADEMGASASIRSRIDAAVNCQQQYQRTQVYSVECRQSLFSPSRRLPDFDY